MTASKVCRHGHRIREGDAFCGQCGETADTGLCPVGHPNPIGNRFCGVCGQELREHPTRTPADDEASDPLQRRRRLLILAAGAILACVGGVMLIARSGSSGRSGAEIQEARPQGIEAWDGVASACNLTGATMIDYQQTQRSDFNAYYVYRDRSGRQGTVAVALNGYGAIAFIYSCAWYEGAPNERVRPGF